MQPVKLVFVDDDKEDRAFIQDALTPLYGDHFLILDSGHDFIKYISDLTPEELPEAVVLDINMPKVDGVQLLQFLKIQETYQRLPVYILTTADNALIKKQCINHGAAGYYIKPASFTEFSRLINEIYNSA